MKKKDVLLLVLVIVQISELLFFAGKYVVWQVNWTGKKGVDVCIYEREHKTSEYVSFGSPFVVNYVENSAKDCINPGFPYIHITTKAEHNAWLQVVYTDHSHAPLQAFIDMPDEKQHPEYAGIAPFYGLGQDFEDCPIWNHSLVEKPLSFWKGHAYAVFVDREAKTIKCVGGIAWGYELSYWRILPKCSIPHALTELDWEKDWGVFKTALPEYKAL